jgi:hypothetical protein
MSTADEKYVACLRRVRRALRKVLKENSVDVVAERVQTAVEGLGPHAVSKSFEERFWARVDKGADCWEWQGKTRAVQLRGDPTTPRRVAWLLYKLPLPKGRVLLATCGNNKCVRPDHMKAGLLGEAARRQRPQGSKPTHARLNAEKVRAIRAAAAAGAKHKELAAWYGVARETIVAVCTRASWAHVRDEEGTP